MYAPASSGQLRCLAGDEPDATCPQSTSCDVSDAREYHATLRDIVVGLQFHANAAVLQAGFVGAQAANTRAYWYVCDVFPTRAETQRATAPLAEHVRGEARISNQHAEH